MGGGLACLRQPADFRRIALEFCEDEAAQGVRYAEASFSLPDHAERFDDWDGPVRGVLEGLAEGERFGIRCRVYVDVVRGIDMALSRRAMETAAAYLDDGVIDWLGGEERFPPEPYAEIFRESRRRGLRSMPHAGETHGPASIRGAIDALGADRIGHGIRILEDTQLVEEVLARGIGLDVCPTSNVMTRSVPSLAEHPSGRCSTRVWSARWRATTRRCSTSGLAAEYEVCRRALGFDDERIETLARNGVRASFADEATKADLERELDVWLASG